MVGPEPGLVGNRGQKDWFQGREVAVSVVM